MREVQPGYARYTIIYNNAKYPGVTIHITADIHEDNQPSAVAMQLADSGRQTLVEMFGREASMWIPDQVESPLGRNLTNER